MPLSSVKAGVSEEAMERVVELNTPEVQERGTKRGEEPDCRCTPVRVKELESEFTLLSGQAPWRLRRAACALVRTRVREAMHVLGRIVGLVFKRAWGFSCWMLVVVSTLCISQLHRRNAATRRSS